MDDLINTMTAYYGVTFTLVIIATVMILAIITVLLPLFVWSIHNQTTRATKELIKLNKLIEEGSAEQSYKDSRTAEMVEEIFKENKIEPPSKDKLPEIPAQAFKRRKIFYKPDDELRDQKKKTS